MAGLFLGGAKATGCTTPAPSSLPAQLGALGNKFPPQPPAPSSSAVCNRPGLGLRLHRPAVREGKTGGCWLLGSGGAQEGGLDLTHRQQAASVAMRTGLGLGLPPGAQLAVCALAVCLRLQAVAEPQPGPQHAACPGWEVGVFFLWLEPRGKQQMGAVTRAGCGGGSQIGISVQFQARALSAGPLAPTPPASFPGEPAQHPVPGSPPVPQHSCPGAHLHPGLPTTLLGTP